MIQFLNVYKKEFGIPLVSFFLIGFSLIVLRSVASFIFPNYFGYVFVAIALFVFFSQIDFEIYKTFSVFLYIGSIIFLILPLVIGQVTRGAVRWIPLGAWSIQPSEIVRPFLLIFIADFLTKKQLNSKRFVLAVLLFTIPVVLILKQPSLGVAVLNSLGFLGTVLSLKYDKKLLLTAIFVSVFLMPFSWLFLAPYQKMRIESLIDPTKDPSGAGYNSIQSMIAVGSGKITGRGLGKGVQTQLSFLPERHTDFIFASIAEELGFLGVLVFFIAIFFLFYRIVSVFSCPKNYTARAFSSGIFLTLFAQTFVHIGMNMGIIPITGVPLPLISSGGSSLVASMIMLGMLLSAKSCV